MKNDKVLSPPESVNEGRKNGKDLGISHLDSEVLHVSRGRFVSPLIEPANFYINNITKSRALHAPSCYRFDGQLLQKLYKLFEEFNDLLKPFFLGL